MPLPASDFTLPEQVSWADVCAALFCTLPFDWSLLWFTALLLCCGLREVFLGLLIFLDNLVIVVLQNLIQQPRPKESCLTSCGMPSGHAVICTSLTCWISCESAQRLQHSKGVMVILLVMGIHLPVLWAKVHLHDHTTTQVFSGAMAGALLGCGYFLLLRRCSRSMAWLCRGLPDNFHREEDGYVTLCG